jgi:hypothetical protein
MQDFIKERVRQGTEVALNRIYRPLVLFLYRLCILIRSETGDANLREANHSSERENERG